MQPPTATDDTGLGRPPCDVDATLEVPMNLLARTVKRTERALMALRPGQVLALHTDDP